MHRPGIKSMMGLPLLGIFLKARHPPTASYQNLWRGTFNKTLLLNFIDSLFFVGNKIILTYLNFSTKRYVGLEIKDKCVWHRRNFWIPKWYAFRMVVAFLVKNEKSPQRNQNLTDVKSRQLSPELPGIPVPVHSDWPIKGPEFYFRPNPGL